MFRGDPRVRSGKSGYSVGVAIIVVAITATFAILAAIPGTRGSGAAPLDGSDRAAAFLPPPLGNVTGTVHNIFGDPVPNAAIKIGTMAVNGDENGDFAIRRIPAGTYRVEVSAPGHRGRKFTYRVQEGANAPRIKYDTGLWPTTFSLDFHAFYPGAGSGRTYGVIGMANPLDMPVYIHRLLILDEAGQTVHDFLATPQQIQTFTITFPSANLALDPYPAVVLQAQSIISHVEMPPHESSEEGRPAQQFTAEVHYSVGRNAPPGERTVVRTVSPRLLDEDYNPHSP